jgi:hypothetical protein
MRSMCSRPLTAPEGNMLSCARPPSEQSSIRLSSMSTVKLCSMDAPALVSRSTSSAVAVLVISTTPDMTKYTQFIGWPCSRVAK